MTTNIHITQCLVIMSIICNHVLTDDSTLKLINMVFRHGDRTLEFPYESYPNDPYRNYIPDPPGNGILTKSGELREYNLGKFLRSRYDNFLEPNYVPGSVKAQSSDVNRTKESLKLVLKALYPDAIIPTTFQLKIKDSLFFPQLCPGYAIEYLKVKGKSDVKEEMARLEPFKKNLSKWTGKKINSARDMFFIYTTLDVEKHMNLTLPSWTKDIYPDGDLLNATLLQYKIMNYNEKMRRRNGGMFIRKFKEDMLSVKDGSMDTNRKINLYSGHDVNIAAVLKALDIYYPHFPKFSSAVILELHFIEKDFYLKVFYYLGIPAELKELQIPGCESLCPLDQFLILMKNVIPTGFDLVCSKVRAFLVQINKTEKMLPNLWVLGLTFITIVYHPVLTDDLTLKLVIVVARNGDRQPDSTHEGYPNDPYKNLNFDGQLTESGRKREEYFGQFLREIYDAFLGPYFPGSVDARSTFENRSKESLNFILKGLFPETAIPTKFDTKFKDTLLFPQICPEYEADYLLAKQNAAMKKELEQLEDFMTELSTWTGKKIESALDIYYLYSTLEAQEFMNLKLPSWTEGVYPEGDLLKGTVLEFMIQNYGKSMIRRNGGWLLRQMIEDMNSVRNNTMDPNRKLIVYAVHNSNIVAILKALELFYPHVPKFSSAIIVELHLIEEVYYIKLLYYLGVPAEIKKLQVPGCDYFCSLDKFSKIMDDVIPSGIRLACEKIRNTFGG
ncbi:uncharacterized protein LOC117178544 [Belonocnema kinseyi]|uniref:uncharacterized protein LOC117178544 n=1 Tax=Belonocnema kinseyi TaxID=2817044 RepID=UPI00143CC778|nr:uncharacterized protein LOC117178544 [Belonocnema kinseyi]